MIKWCLKVGQKSLIKVLLNIVNCNTGIECVFVPYICALRMVLISDLVSQVAQVLFIEDTALNSAAFNIFAVATLVLKFIQDDALEVHLVE